MREVLGSFVGRQFLDHSVFTVLAFQGNIEHSYFKIDVLKKNHDQGHDCGHQYCFLKKNLYFSTLKWIFFFFH